jgi:hypothetical protein
MNTSWWYIKPGHETHEPSPAGCKHVTMPGPSRACGRSNRRRAQYGTLARNDSASRYFPVDTEQTIRWKREWCGKKWGKTVWVDVLKLDAVLQLEPYRYVGVGGQNGIDGRYVGVGEFVASGKALLMPRVGLGGDANHRTIQIYDGRHRFAWMRDHGADALPVIVLVGQARKIARLVGTKARVCRVRMIRELDNDRFFDDPACGPLEGLTEGDRRMYEYLKS